MFSRCVSAKNSEFQRGNLLFMIFLAVILIAALSAVVMQGFDSAISNIDSETLSLRASEFQRAGAEFERAVAMIVNTGVSESDIRFAHPDASADYGDLGADSDPSNQVFHAAGGGATYVDAPADINDGSDWEFFGGTAIPGVGSDRADLVAVLPAVTDAFCAKINALNAQDAPQDTGAGFGTVASAGSCVFTGAAGRFDDNVQFYSTPNTMDESTFAQDAGISAARPAGEACVVCAADNKNYAYHVILAR